MATKSQQEAQQQIAEWRYEYLECRDMGHTWGSVEYEDHRRQTGVVMRYLTCSSCTTERIDSIDHKSGDIVRRKYNYPEGYIRTKHYKREDLRKADVRAEVLRRYLHGSK